MEGGAWAGSCGQRECKRMSVARVSACAHVRGTACGTGAHVCVCVVCA